MHVRVRVCTHLMMCVCVPVSLCVEDDRANSWKN